MANVISVINTGYLPSVMDVVLNWKAVALVCTVLNT